MKDEYTGMVYIRDMNELNKNNMDNQLNLVRVHKHEKYTAECDAKRLTEDIWPNVTIGKETE